LPARTFSTRTFSTFGSVPGWFAVRLAIGLRALLSAAVRLISGVEHRGDREGPEEGEQDRQD
jgi:hypothetical protein